MNSACLLKLEDHGVSQLLFINEMIEQRVQGRGQQVFHQEGGSDANDVTVSHNVDGSNVVHTNQQTTGTHTQQWPLKLP